MNSFTKSFGIIGLVLLSAQSMSGGLVSSTPSMKEFESGMEKLTVYTDVPGLKPSSIYEIRVRSAASDYKWVTFDNGENSVLLTKDNFDRYFEKNEYVQNLQFEKP